MRSINDLRTALPDLEGLSDDQAVDYIQQVYYPNRDRGEIASRLGIAPPPPPEPQEPGLMRSAADARKADAPAPGKKPADSGPSIMDRVIGAAKGAGEAVGSFVSDSAHDNRYEAQEQARKLLSSNVRGNEMRQFLSQWGSLLDPGLRAELQARAAG